MVIVTVFIIKDVSGKSGRYFRPTKELGDWERLYWRNDVWSKVVKAFAHERESIEDFDRINDQLFESSYQANRYANVLMPILGNLGNVSFVLTALIGDFLR